jgi:hypothetical protein
MKSFLLLAFILLFASLAVLSQEDVSNDPNDNPDANACFEGGAMEGKCNQDIDGDGVVEDFEVLWAWQCGWYMVRYDYEIYSRDEIPGACDTLLPALPERTAEDNCYILRDIGNIQISLLYTGPSNSPYNFLKFNNLNCMGNPVAFSPSNTESLVSANTYPEAFAICQSLPGLQVFMENSPMQSHDPSAPANLWYCTLNVIP